MPILNEEMYTNFNYCLQVNKWERQPRALPKHTLHFPETYNHLLGYL